MPKEQEEIYKQKALKMNEDYLVDWRKKYNEKKRISFKFVMN